MNFELKKLYEMLFLRPDQWRSRWPACVRARGKLSGLGVLDVEQQKKLTKGDETRGSMPPNIRPI